MRTREGHKVTGLVNRADNLCTIKDNQTHSAHKKALSNCFTKSFIMSSQTARAATRDVLFKRFLPIIHKSVAENKPLEVLELRYSYLLDIFVQWHLVNRCAVT